MQRTILDDKMGSQQKITLVKRDEPALHFFPFACGPCFWGAPDLEMVTIMEGSQKGKRAIITWGLNLPIEACREPSFGFNSHRLAQFEENSKHCEIMIALDASL